MSLQLSKKKTHYNVSIPEEAAAVASVGTVSQISLEQVVALKNRIWPSGKLHKWYEKSFGKDYLLIYRHRDRRQAEKEVFRMMEWLKLPTQGRSLDLCCGMGRHAMSLARAGYRVTGVDLSSELLQEARASDPNELVNWVECDMRALPESKRFKERFDAVVNLFTSFGYFEEDSEQLTVLRQIHKALKPGGRFIIDYMNAEYTTDHLVPFSER